MFAASKSGGVVISGGSTDSSFGNVTLLLNDTGTNGAQNNTFIDSSSNGLTVTRTGNVTQGSITPYRPDGNWGNYFNGSTDYFKTPSNAVFAFGSGDFTIEGWFCRVARTQTNAIFIGNFPASAYSTNSIKLTDDNGNPNKFSFITFNLSISLVGTTTISNGVWYHVAVTRSGTTFRLFVNGSQEASTTASGNVDGNSSHQYAVGYSDNVSSTYFNGYASNVRIVKGTALYTSNFTPSTTPLTAVSGTSLLTCQSNRFIDNSSNKFALTLTGTPQVQIFSPFEPSVDYSTSSYGGSGEQFVSGSYLSFTGQTFSGDFCAECWVYRTSNNAGSGYSVVFGGSQTTGADNHQFIIYNNGGIALVLASVLVIASSGTAFINNQWNHCVWNRSGTNCAVFVNGVRQGTATSSSSTSICSRLGDIAGLSGYSPNGAIANARIVLGSSVYDPTQTTLTIPTSPVTNITNTQVLLNFANAGIYDAAWSNNLLTGGNAQASTTQSKWGSSSIKFDGTGDYLTALTKPNLNFGGANFTIECWVYPSTNSTAQTLWYKSDSDFTGVLLGLNTNGAGKVNFYAGNGSSWYVAIDSSSTISTSTWTHIAVTRNQSTWTIWINGSSAGTATSSTNPTDTTADVKIGRFRPAALNDFNGYIDDLRVTYGIARYTSSFTPPSAPFPTR